MTKTTILETIQQIEQGTPTAHLNFQFLNKLPSDEREYFQTLLRRRDDLGVLLETDHSPEDLDRGLIYHIAFHGLQHQEVSAQSFLEELRITVLSFDLLKLLDRNTVNVTAIEERLFTAYAGILLLSPEISSERARVEHALLREFKFGAAIQPGLWGHRVHHENFRNTLHVLKNASDKELHHTLTH